MLFVFDFNLIFALDAQSPAAQRVAVKRTEARDG